MRNLALFTLLSLALGLSLHAADPVDLGQGLSYLRVHSLADEQATITKLLSGSHALVLDLRYANATDESAAALRSALAARSAGSTFFALVSSATPASVAAVVGSELTLGATDTRPVPRVIVQSEAATDRRAYDAHDAGTPLADLINGRVEKERYDEASLVHDFKNGNPAPAPPPGPDPTVAKPGESAKSPPLSDRVLQRAVHLHRALLALRRPPAAK